MYWRHSQVVMCQKMANSQSTIKTQAAVTSGAELNGAFSASNLVWSAVAGARSADASV
ncbi:hypothetical protein MRBBS_0023 [Marinobacter sp. BSs20148]|nr:hypothetical protein MRBBS_0023 [Marinobacter sp. BSs20148]